MINKIWVAAVCLAASAAMAGSLPAYEPDATADYDEIPAVYKWDLSPMFRSDQDWEKSLGTLRKEVEDLTGFKGKLSSAKMIKDCLDSYFDLMNRTNYVTLYAGLRLTTAQSDDRRQGMQARSLDLMDRVMAESSFIRTELLALPEGAMDRMYRELPELEVHRAYIDDILRRRSRVLNPEAERVMSIMGDNLWAEIDLNEIPSSLEDAFRNAMADIPWPMVHDEDGREVQLTLANYGFYRASKNREVRREVVTAFMATLRQYRHLLAATLAGQYELDVAYARARGYDTALEAYLDKDALDTAVYDNLVDTINANLEPLHRYVELRKKVMGVEELHLYDLYVPMVADLDVEIPFEDAREQILKALVPLGEEYMEMLREGLDPHNGWLDLYPALDKDSGASSSRVYGAHPFIKMNYQNTMDNMSTLAHEYGHALHSVLSMKSQPYSTYNYAPFLAEIASTCNEVLLSDYLVKNARNKAERAYILTELAESIRTTIYRQTLFAEFERVVHGYVEEGVPVTATLLNETYTDLIKRYYGPGFTLDENDGLEWAYIPHFYYKYYVFNYATGLSSGIAVAEKVQRAEPGAVKAYLGMLSGGSSKPPLDLLRGAGVDLTKPDTIESAMKLFERTVAELETLL